VNVDFADSKVAIFKVPVKRFYQKAPVHNYNCSEELAGLPRGNIHTKPFILTGHAELISASLPGLRLGNPYNSRESRR